MKHAKLNVVFKYLLIIETIESVKLLIFNFLTIFNVIK